MVAWFSVFSARFLFVFPVSVEIQLTCIAEVFGGELRCDGYLHQVAGTLRTRLVSMWFGLCAIHFRKCAQRLVCSSGEGGPS